MSRFDAVLAELTLVLEGMPRLPRSTVIIKPNDKGIAQAHLFGVAVLVDLLAFDAAHDKLHAAEAMLRQLGWRGGITVRRLAIHAAMGLTLSAMEKNILGRLLVTPKVYVTELTDEGRVEAFRLCTKGIVVVTTSTGFGYIELTAVGRAMMEAIAKPHG